MKRAIVVLTCVLTGALVPIPGATAGAAPAGGGIVVRVGEGGSECAYRPNQLIAPEGSGPKIVDLLGIKVEEVTPLTPDGKSSNYPPYLDRLSLYAIGGVDPLDAAAALSQVGIVAAPNYLSSFSPVRTWAPGEDAVAVAGAYGPVNPSWVGKGLRIGVFDSGLARKFSYVMPGGTVTYVSAASRRVELAGRGLIDPAYVQPVEQTTGRVAGHGTFIAGLIRRVAPGAQIVAAQVPYYDVADAMHTVDANPAFASQETARVDDAAVAYMMTTAFMTGGVTNVDALSISFGSYGCNELAAPAGGDGDFRTPIGVRNALLHLWEASGRRMQVTAAAGNDSTDERFYPAAFAASNCFVPSQLPAWGGADCSALPDAKSEWLTSAGSTDSKLGSFSNTGSWVRNVADGSDVISRNHAYNFMSWSGTSFAAPCLSITGLINGWNDWNSAPTSVIDCKLG